MSYIRLVNVTKRFGDVTAVDNLNIEIGKIKEQQALLFIALF